MILDPQLKVHLTFLTMIPALIVLFVVLPRSSTAFTTRPFPFSNRFGTAFGRSCVHLTASQSDNNDDALKRVLTRVTSDPRQSLGFSALMTVSGALLGPFLDSFHSAFGVLLYDTPLTLQLWGSDASHPALITAWWVPELFGLAGFLIGWLYILLDAYLIETPKEREKTLSVSPAKIFLGISMFTFQYWLSGAMFKMGLDRSTILNIMSFVAATGFLVLDSSFAGLLTSAATAVGGPLIEVGLLTLSQNDNFFHGTGYHYSDWGETGFFPLWIVPVYFLGGPANGNLARGYWKLLRQGQEVEGIVPETPKEPPGCKVCDDTRRVPCPNCDGLGIYQAMGGRMAKCTSCRSRGFVICRACFDFYSEDPNDMKPFAR